MCGNVKNDFFFAKVIFLQISNRRQFYPRIHRQGGTARRRLCEFEAFSSISRGVFNTLSPGNLEGNIDSAPFIQLSWSILLWPAFPRLNWMKWYFCKKSGKCKQSWVKSRQSLSGVDSPAYSILDSQSTKRRPDFFDVKGQKLHKCTAVHIWSWRKGKRSKKMKIQDFYLQYCWNIWKRLSIILQIKKFSNSNFYHLEWIWKYPAKSSTTIDYGYIHFLLF